MKFLQFLYRRFRDHRLIDLGAQCAYYLLLSLFPLLIFAVTLLSYLPFTFMELYTFLKTDYIPSEVLQVVEDQWTFITHQERTGALSFGVIFTLWTASLALNAILRSLNLAYHVTEERGVILSRFMSIGLTIVLLLVVLAAFLFQIIGDQWSKYFAVESIFYNSYIFRWLLTSLLLFAVFLILYLVGPNLKLRLGEVYIGALFTTIGWQIATFGFSVYLDHFNNFTATYGTLGAIIALIIWFHLTSVLLLLGGEINAMLKEDID
ncbi:YihY/virulence factor BrkB family protein [Texcoconibacillus texcoconensis]|uniref:Membrane protein n=1 Tax=Texcoconibacillus texcoconensis TaxID=1095777 RepID=A0A840QQ70_9BACI|nr:YihY/virulence factor BrkB family protein [Texcoconibacillus texcoconensis]MBB5173473.1 membrane protein [Texcoconibacillus texcoconensis]